MGSLNYPNKVKDVYKKLVFTNDGTNLLHDGSSDTAITNITANITGTASDITNHFTGLSLTDLTSDDFLKWDGSKWINGPVGSAVKMEELQDANITEPANNAILKYDSSSSKWVDSDALGAGLQATLSYDAPLENTSNPSTSAQIKTALDLKANLESPTFTGTIAIPNISNLETAVAANTAKNTYPSGDSTKVGYLTVTQAVDLDTMESNIATNNAKNTNVSTALSQGTTSTTVYNITSDGGTDDLAIPTATTTQAGVMSSALWDKLDAIEASADVTDATNVTAAGALMDSELTDLAGVKGVTISTLQVKPSEGAFANGDKTKLDGIAANANNYTHTTNANLTGHVTSTGNAAVLGSFTVAQLSAALSDASISGNNTGDQTKADFDVDHVIALIGAAADTSENLGTFTGSTITDDQTIKSALQLLETSLELKAPLASPTFTGTLYLGTSAEIRIGGNIRLDADPVTLLDGAGSDLDFDDHCLIRATFGDTGAYAVTVTLQEPTAGSGWKTLIVTQAGDTNAQTLTYATSGSSTVVWPGGVAPTLSTGNAEIDMISFFYDSTAGKWYGNYGMDYS